MANSKYAKVSVSSKSLKKITANRKLMIAGGCFLGLVVVILGIFIYYSKVYSDPQRTFWAMIDNNLSTPGITKQTDQQSDQGAVNNITQLVFSPSPRIHYVKKITDKSTAAGAHLTLEGVGAPDADYQRYSYIDRPGHTSNYSKIYNMWLKGDQPQLYNSAIFGGFLFGDISQPQRSEIVGKIRDAYEVKAEPNTKTAYSHSRTYSVTITMQKYAVALHDYAKAAGLPGADQISPSLYQAGTKAQVKVTVDVLSRQITKVEYIDSGVTENYYSYGVAANINVPSKTVGSDEFQKTLNSILQ